MKSLTVKQPWAWAIVAGHKRIENRTWTTRYRGPIIIVAGQARDRLTIGSAFLADLGISVPRTLRFGAAIGVVDIIDIVRPHELDDPFAEGPWCWLLARPRRFRSPIAAQGHLGLRAFALPKTGSR